LEGACARVGKCTAIVQHEEALTAQRQVQAVIGEIDVALRELLSDVRDTYAVSDRNRAHALRRHREKLREFSARALEARGRRVRNVVGRYGEIGLGRIQSAQR
jgi:hypothetical protein